MKKIGGVAYQLALSHEARIHLMFHISLLKECEDDPGSLAKYIALPLLTSEVGPRLHPIFVSQR